MGRLAPRVLSQIKGGHTMAYPERAAREIELRHRLREQELIIQALLSELKTPATRPDNEQEKARPAADSERVADWALASGDYLI
jgi:hypothetical protein